MLGGPGTVKGHPLHFSRDMLYTFWTREHPLIRGSYGMEGGKHGIAEAEIYPVI
jgi:hypothetical protein